MRPTLFGLQSLAFFGAMLLAYFASPYANLSFLLLAFLTLTGAFGLGWGLWNLRGVTGALDELEPLPAGVELTSSEPGTGVRARVHGGRRTRFGLRVRVVLERGAPADARAERVVLEGGAGVLSGDAWVPLTVPKLERGVYRVVRAELASTYPLGLLERRRPIAAPTELACYPAPGLDSEARTGSQLLAEVLGAGADGGEQLQPAGLRDYAEGDSLRSIHWRATARVGHPVVREWDGSGGGGLEVCLDRRCAPDELEEALGLLSALARLAREQKESLALSTQGLRETYGPGQRPWSELLWFLAAAEPLAADGPPPPAVSPAVTRLPAGRVQTSRVQAGRAQAGRAQAGREVPVG